MSKRDAAVYVRAAKRIDSGEHTFCCLAIEGNCSKFCAYFQPTNLRYNRHPFWNRSRSPKRQQMRVLALLFMAAIAENP